MENSDFVILLRARGRASWSWYALVVEPCGQALWSGSVGKNLPWLGLVVDVAVELSGRLGGWLDALESWWVYRCGVVRGWEVFEFVFALSWWRHKPLVSFYKLFSRCTHDRSRKRPSSSGFYFTPQKKKKATTAHAVSSYSPEYRWCLVWVGWGSLCAFFLDASYMRVCPSVRQSVCWSVRNV